MGHYVKTGAGTMENRNKTTAGAVNKTKVKNMKQTWGIMGIVAGLLLLIGAVGAYAYTTSDGYWNMMGNSGINAGMMNGNYRYRMNNNGGYTGMMGNIDFQTREQLNTIHKQVIKNMDPETARLMDAMHDACIGYNDYTGGA